MFMFKRGQVGWIAERILALVLVIIAAGAMGITALTIAYGVLNMLGYFVDI
jgi:hypothetical protein